MALMANPEIQTIALSSIHPDPENPREISAPALAGLQKSLERFGYVDLLVVNKRNMQLVSGHQRFKVLTAAKAKEVPVILVDVDPAQQKALAITLNNPEIQGDWSEALGPMIEKLRNELPASSFFDLRLEELRDSVKEIELSSVGETVDAIAAKPVTLTYRLGNHVLTTGSESKDGEIKAIVEAWEKFTGKKAELVRG